MNTEVAAPSTAMPIVVAKALWRGFLSIGRLRESWVGVAGLILVLFWVLVAVLAPIIAPVDPNMPITPFAKPGTTVPLPVAVDLSPLAKYLAEAQQHTHTFWLGADHLGRDILSRIIWGTRTVLFYAPLATVAAYTVGILMGLAAGYRGGLVDDILSRIADIILSFPVLVLYIIIIAIIGASGINIIIAITFASSPGIMRIVRGLVLDLRTRDYIFAAQTRGESHWYIMLIELLPNARGPLIVDACLRLGYVIITIGVLGFLGLGLAAARSRLGRYGQRNPADGVGFPAHDHVPVHRHLVADSRLQLARRRLARNFPARLTEII